MKRLPFPSLFVRSALVLASLIVLKGSAALAFSVEMSSVFDPNVSGNYRARPLDGLEIHLANYSPLATDGQWFGTFCLEADEYITTGGYYDVTINWQATAGGTNTNSGDPLSQGTAFLYKEFALGNLSSLTGGVFDYSALSSSGALQNLIWSLEEENYSVAGGDASVATALQDLLVAEFGNVTSAMVNYSGPDVRVMNLTSGDNVLNQDQLILVNEPGGGTLNVPDGGNSALLLSISCAAMATWRSRKAVGAALFGRA